MTSTEDLYSIFLSHNLICTDTREIKKDSIFFSLKGPTFNGNEFAYSALEKGCAYVVVDEKKYVKNDKYILVDDVLKSLQKLATYHRKQFEIPVIAITGSNGKTTTKELISSVLSEKYKTLATKGNLNNHIGVPLTLLQLNAEHEIAVIEMGANHIEEIEHLCKIARPTHGIITNIGKAHLEGFGGEEGVIKAKSELYHFIRTHEGTLFVNSDNELLQSLSAGIECENYGTGSPTDCLGKLISSNPFVELEYTYHENAPTTIQTKIIGKYNLENVLAAICIGEYFHVDPSQIKNAISNYESNNNRSQLVVKGVNNILLDAYNANPTSMQAALSNLQSLPGASKIVILGDMLELGTDSFNEHQKIVDQLSSTKLANVVVLVGSYFSAIDNSKLNAKQFMNSEEALLWVKAQSFQESTILIKGSRGIKLEKLLEAF